MSINNEPATNEDANDFENEAVATASSTADEFRVKDVIQINQEIQEDSENSSDTSDLPKKRKIPNWLLTDQPENGDSSTAAKKQKLKNRQNTKPSCDISSPNSNNISSQSITTSDNACEASTSGNPCEASTHSAIDETPIVTTIGGSPQNIENIQIKKEVDDDDVEPNSSAEAASGILPEVKKEVKTEPCDSSDQPSTSSNADGAPQNPPERKPTPVVPVKQEATSTIRDSCQFGIRCYRRNPQHRLEMAHPGDSDYRRPDFPVPPKGTPDCPYGIRCYRRNPVHFQQYAHPPSTDPEKNRKERLRKLAKKGYVDPDYDFLSDDEDDLNDPFNADDDSTEEYQPEGSGNDTDTEMENSEIL